MYLSKKRNPNKEVCSNTEQLKPEADADASAAHATINPFMKMLFAIVCMAVVFIMLLTGCSGVQTFGGEAREAKTVDSVSDITKNDLNGIWEFKGFMRSSDYNESSSDSHNDEEIEKLLMMPLFDGCYLTFDDKYNVHFDYMNSRTSGNYSLDGHRVIIATGDLLDDSKNKTGTALGAQAQFSDGNKSSLLVHNGDGVKYILIFERFNGSESDKTKFNIFTAHEKQLAAIEDLLDKDESMTDEEKSQYLESFKHAQKEDEKFFESDGITPKSNSTETTTSQQTNNSKPNPQSEEDVGTDITRDLNNEMESNSEE